MDYETKLPTPSQEFVNECQIQRMDRILERINIVGSAKVWYNYNQDLVVTTRRNKFIRNIC